MSLISLVIVLIVVCVVYWAIIQILAAFGIGNPIATVIKVLFVLVVVLWLVQNLGIISGGPILRVH
jgi:uncharacterized membrane protein YwzB